MRRSLQRYRRPDRPVWSCFSRFNSDASGILSRSAGRPDSSDTVAQIFGQPIQRHCRSYLGLLDSPDGVWPNRCPCLWPICPCFPLPGPTTFCSWPQPLARSLPFYQTSFAWRLVCAPAPAPDGQPVLNARPFRATRPPCSPRRQSAPAMPSRRREIRHPLVLEFLGRRWYSESDLEDALIRHSKPSFGTGQRLTFVAPAPLRIDDEWYRVDLLFFTGACAAWSSSI